MFARQVCARFGSPQFRPWGSRRLVVSMMLPATEVASMRISYDNEKFDESDLTAKEPIAQFDAWFRRATNTPNIGEANAMTLATCSA